MDEIEMQEFHPEVVQNEKREQVVTRLREFMAERGLTYNRLAEETGRDHSGVYRFVNGQRKIPPGFEFAFERTYGHAARVQVFGEVPE